jgi:BCD family chlorophyll transporter-like MFS transporter
MTATIASNPVARVFFVYLLLLLAALLGQDVLLEPFGAQAFGMTIEQTSRFVSIMGTFTLLAFILAGALEGRVRKRLLAQVGNLTALAGFVTILVSGLMQSSGIFYLGLVLLGFGTGLSTVANLSLMFDLTVPEQVGLYIGAWGFSNGLSRLVGLFLAGIVADLGARATGSALNGYLIVFGIEALMLLVAALLLARIDVPAFHQRAADPSFSEKLALASD